MTENAGAPRKLEDCEALEAFLRTEPREVSVIVAARAALRALPLFFLYRPEPTAPRDAQRFANTAARLFRALALAHAAGKWPRRVKELPTAHAAAAAGAAYAAAHASYSADAADTADAAAACAAYAAVRAVEAAEAFVSFAGPQGYTAAAADAAAAATAAAVAYVSFATAATSSAALTAARAGLWAAVLADVTFFRKRRSRPIVRFGPEELDASREVQRAAGAGLAAQGSSSSIRDCGCPDAMASRVAFIQA